eukprot:TRINITY_DN25866_c0_g2_i1.p1 TRINITY_DN25866_c0_g2~~TRINITY_DN25866_c0_g2_i1.p1  ORF type:complete len:1361 (+),score=178.91 TRINITY_DN25866_c0_g2_i1:115-4197(+)
MVCLRVCGRIRLCNLLGAGRVGHRDEFTDSLIDVANETFWKMAVSDRKADGRSRTLSKITDGDGDSDTDDSELNRSTFLRAVSTPPPPGGGSQSGTESPSSEPESCAFSRAHTNQSRSCSQASMRPVSQIGEAAAQPADGPVMANDGDHTETAVSEGPTGLSMQQDTEERTEEDHSHLPAPDLQTRHAIAVDYDSLVMAYRRQQQAQHHMDSLHEVGVLGCHNSFGEVALQFNEPRSATIKTIEDCIFATLRRADYEALMIGTVQEHKQGCIEFIRDSPLLSGLQQTVLERTAAMMHLRTFVKHMPAVTFNQTVVQVIFVVEGHFDCYTLPAEKTLKQDDGDAPETGRNDERSSSKNPTQTRTAAELVKTGELLPGQYYGLHEFLRGEKRYRSQVVCSSPSAKAYTVLAKDLASSLGAATRSKLLQGSQLQQNFCQYKAGILASISKGADAKLHHSEPRRRQRDSSLSQLRADPADDWHPERTEAHKLACSGKRRWPPEESYRERLERTRKAAAGEAPANTSIYVPEGRLSTISAARQGHTTHPDLGAALAPDIVADEILQTVGAPDLPDPREKAVSVFPIPIQGYDKPLHRSSRLAAAAGEAAAAPLPRAQPPPLPRAPVLRADPSFIQECRSGSSAIVHYYRRGITHQGAQVIQLTRPRPVPAAPSRVTEQQAPERHYSIARTRLSRSKTADTQLGMGPKFHIRQKTLECLSGDAAHSPRSGRVTFKNRTSLEGDGRPASEDGASEFEGEELPMVSSLDTYNSFDGAGVGRIISVPPDTTTDFHVDEEMFGEASSSAPFARRATTMGGRVDAQFHCDSGMDFHGVQRTRSETYTQSSRVSARSLSSRPHDMSSSDVAGILSDRARACSPIQPAILPTVSSFSFSRHVSAEGGPDSPQPPLQLPRLLSSQSQRPRPSPLSRQSSRGAEGEAKSGKLVDHFPLESGSEKMPEARSVNASYVDLGAHPSFGCIADIAPRDASSRPTTGKSAISPVHEASPQHEALSPLRPLPPRGPPSAGSISSGSSHLSPRIAPGGSGSPTPSKTTTSGPSRTERRLQSSSQSSRPTTSTSDDLDMALDHTEALADELMQLMDRIGHNGQLTLTELQAFGGSSCSKELKSFMQWLTNLRHHKFFEMDTDHDGVLSVEELEASIVEFQEYIEALAPKTTGRRMQPGEDIRFVAKRVSLAEGMINRRRRRKKKLSAQQADSQCARRASAKGEEQHLDRDEEEEEDVVEPLFSPGLKSKLLVPVQLPRVDHGGILRTTSQHRPMASEIQDLDMPWTIEKNQVPSGLVYHMSPGRGSVSWKEEEKPHKPRLKLPHLGLAYKATTVVPRQVRPPAGPRSARTARPATFILPAIRA